VLIDGIKIHYYRSGGKTPPEDEVITWANARKLWDKALFNKIGINMRPYEEIAAEIQCPTLLIIYSCCSDFIL
jgi:hypothetical protein